MDGFDEWREQANGGKKTTLRQQFELGVRLFVESLPKPHPFVEAHCYNQDVMVKKVLEVVEDTPFRREGLVSWQGIGVASFLYTFCYSPFMRLARDFGCEAWFVRKVCVIVLVFFGSFESVGFDIDFGARRSFVDNAPHSQKPTIFLSYTGAHKWSDVVESLEQLNPLDVVWFDIVCVNQFAWTGTSRQEEKFHNKFLDDLECQIKTIGQTVLILGAWDNVMKTLGKIWVLWEMFVTSGYLEILLTEGQKVHINQNWGKQAQFAQLNPQLGKLDEQQFLEIDVNNAKAEDDEERRAILNHMRGHGLEKVNKKVRTRMRWWLAEPSTCVRTFELGNVRQQARFFDEWVRTANRGNKTTLRQQFELAVSLFVESLEHPHQYKQDLMVDKVLAIVERTPFRSKGLVSWQGVEVGWFLHTFCSSPFMRRVSNFECEAWFVRKVCVIVLMVFGSSENVGFDINFGRPGPFVNNILPDSALWRRPRALKPAIFLSYTGGYKWSHVVECLQQLSPMDVVWFDIVCVNQFAWTGSGRRSSQEEQCHNKFLDDLRCQIETIGRTVLMLGKWENVMDTLSQIWVLWEVFVTSACRADMEALLTRWQEARFASSYKLLDQTQFLASIDANKATAEDDVERESILARMRRVGLDEVTKNVRVVMRTWLSRQCVRFKCEAAERQLDAAVKGSRRQLGDTHPETCVCIFQLAQMQRELGNAREAETTLRSALEAHQQGLGRSHPDTLTCMGYLAAFLEELKRYEEASSLLAELLQLQVEVLGSDHPHTCLTVFCLQYCVSRVKSSS